MDAYDDPTIEADLHAFSLQYRLPDCEMTGCFEKVNQGGAATNYPAPNTGWSLEIALDVETVHGICPDCKIVLVEANSNSFADLGAAENEAAALHANVISNSWGGGESSGEASLDSLYFTHADTVITASSGDSGYGVEYPAASPNVVAVGGTTSSLTGSAGYGSETAWVDGGSGCSRYELKPSVQKDTGCAKRTVVDVSADADPNSGAAIDDSYGSGGWVQVGGTSLASPLIAAVYALSGNTTNGNAPYANPGALHDVTSGSNGRCSPSYLCKAGTGYDGPTGLGTPNGLAAFNSSASPPLPADYTFAVTPLSQTVTAGELDDLHGVDHAQRQLRQQQRERLGQWSAEQRDALHADRDEDELHAERHDQREHHAQDLSSHVQLHRRRSAVVSGGRVPGRAASAPGLLAHDLSDEPVTSHTWFDDLHGNDHADRQFHRSRHARRVRSPHELRHRLRAESGLETSTTLTITAPKGSTGYVHSHGDRYERHALPQQDRLALRSIATGAQTDALLPVRADLRAFLCKVQELARTPTRIRPPELPVKEN